MVGFAHIDLAGGKQGPEQHGSGVRGRPHGLILLNSSCNPLDCIRVSNNFRVALSQTKNRLAAVPCFGN